MSLNVSVSAGVLLWDRTGTDLPVTGGECTTGIVCGLCFIYSCNGSHQHELVNSNPTGTAPAGDFQSPV